MWTWEFNFEITFSAVLDDVLGVTTDSRVASERQLDLGNDATTGWSRK